MQPISALEYGALGVLCLVLAGVGKIGWDWLKGNGERMDKQDGWMRDLIASDRSERKEHIQAWQMMVERDIEARDVMNGALESLCVVIESTAKEGKEERAALTAILSRHEGVQRECYAELLTAIRAAGDSCSCRSALWQRAGITQSRHKTDSGRQQGRGGGMDA